MNVCIRAGGYLADQLCGFQAIAVLAVSGLLVIVGLGEGLQ